MIAPYSWNGGIGRARARSQQLVHGLATAFISLQFMNNGNLKKRMNPSIQVKTTILPLLITFTLLWSTLSPVAQAVSPPPDGGYPGRNTAEGDSALHSLTFGADNTAIGFKALFSNTVGNNNTAVGALALRANVGTIRPDLTGFVNTAIGRGALYSNISGNRNTATGANALFFNTTGKSNTATGDSALERNSTGESNTATGAAALISNRVGNRNTATGVNALKFNSSGNGNTATGVGALQDNTTGDDNVAIGRSALAGNTTGNGNTATGIDALFSKTIGDRNTAMGLHALASLTSGDNNVALGEFAGSQITSGDNNIDIGSQGSPGESRTIRIGTQATQTATYIAGISGTPVVNGMPVAVSASGQLGLAPVSSKRFKDEIKPMDKASEAILALKPVTFHYKKELDPAGTQQFGLVAEEVEKIDRALVVRDAEGKAYTVRYDAVNAMLLNEFLKEHRKSEKRETTIADLKAEIATLSAGLKEQAAQIHKVSAQLAAASPSHGGLEVRNPWPANGLQRSPKIAESSW